jgi:hypothetical protein
MLLSPGLGGLFVCDEDSALWKRDGYTIYW